MVEPAMVGRMVHGDFANAILTCSKMEQIAQKNLYISNKSRTFAYGFHE